MTSKAKIIWIGLGSLLVATGIWLWWRSKDAVPLAAVPVMQQARAVLAISAGGTAAPAATPAAITADFTQTVLQSVIPGYVPLPISSPS